MPTRAQFLNAVIDRIALAARETHRPLPRLVAVSKTQPAAAVVEVARAWMARCAIDAPGDVAPIAFGENYVQEGLTKQDAVAALLPDAAIEWHLIGHLQTNKAREVAQRFDWVQSVDRVRLVDALAKHRRAEQGPLNVLVQVNVDDEASKSGCTLDDVPALCEAIAAQPTLRLRGLMAIPAPHADVALRREAFKRVRGLFDAVRTVHPSVDTVSMGMSDDLDIAIAEGATLVRVGTGVFGARK